jgi:Mrp family chromosome partitioning ATPase
MKDASVESARFEPTVFGAVRRYRIMVAAFALAGMVAAIGYTLHHGKSYAGKASVTVPASQGGQSVDSEVLLMESSAVAQRAASIANTTLHDKIVSAQNFYNGGGSLTLFPPAGAASGSYGASIIGVTFTSSNPKVAQVGANALIQAFNQQRTADIEAQYNQAIAGIDHTIIGTTDPAQRTAIQSQRNQQLVNQQMDLAQQPVVVWAIEPTSPSSSGVKKTAAEGLVIGLLLGVTVAYVRASRRQGFVDQHDPAALFGVPLIGDIPATKAEKALRSNGAAADGLPMSADPHSATAEAFRFGAGSVERIRAERGPRLSFVFVSPRASVGRSKVIANLALAIAEGGTRVLVVDADAGDGSLATRLLLGFPTDDGGLEQILAGERSLADCIHPSLLNDAVAVLGPGPAPHQRVTGAARAKAASALLATAKSSFDIVLIDSPGLLQVADASELAGASDAAIIVLGPDELTRDHEETMDRLNLIGSDVVGYIYDGMPMSAPRVRYQHNGSSGNLVPPASSASGSSARPMVFDPAIGDFPSLSFKQPLHGRNGLSTELRIDGKDKAP